MKQVFEGVVREDTINHGLKVIDPPKADKDVVDWLAVSGGHPAKLGERYRVTIERIRAPLPEGYEWDGDVIVCRAVGARWLVVMWVMPGSQPQHKAVDCRNAAAVPSFVIDAFRAEGLL